MDSDGHGHSIVIENDYNIDGILDGGTELLVFPSFINGLPLPEVQLQFPHSLMAQYISIPYEGVLATESYPFQARRHPFGAMAHSSQRLPSLNRHHSRLSGRPSSSPARRPPLDDAEREEISRQIASYADQVKDMKGRINWLQENLRQGGRGRSSAEEHAEDLGKFFAVQTMKVEELGQQIDVFSEELKHWEHVDAKFQRPENRFSSLVHTVVEADGFNEQPSEAVRIQLSDLVNPSCTSLVVKSAMGSSSSSPRTEQETQRISITTKDLEMKRKAMGAKKAKHEAKRRKVQEVQQHHKLPFKVGVARLGEMVDLTSGNKTAGRRSQGVRTGELRKSSSGTNSNVVKGLQSELLQIKELLEDRDQQLCQEKNKTYEMESRHEMEVEALVKEVEVKAGHLKQEQALRAEAEEKVVDLESQIKKMEEERRESQVEMVQTGDTTGEELVERKDEEHVSPPEEKSDELCRTKENEHCMNSCGNEVVAGDELGGGLQHEQEMHVLDAQQEMHVPDGQCGLEPSNDTAISRFYGREIAINTFQLRQALKLKSIAEAKVENLKKQVAALKKLTGELQNEQYCRFRKESGSIDMEKQKMQLLQLKKLVAEKTRELEVEQSRRAEEQSDSCAILSRLENEVASYKKLALERAADLKTERKQKFKIECQSKDLQSQMDAIKAQVKPYGQLKVESQSYDSISHKQNRRLQLNVKKLRQKYEQLQDTLRKEQECRLAAENQSRKLGAICADQIVKLDELDLLVEHFAKELDEQRGHWAEMETKFKLLEQESREKADNHAQPLNSGFSLHDLAKCRSASFLPEKLNKKLGQEKAHESKSGRSKKGKVDACPGDSKIETSEKLLFLLDKLAKGIDHEQKPPSEEGKSDVERKPDTLEKLLSQIRKATRGMGTILKQELSWGLECEQKGNPPTLTVKAPSDYDSGAEQAEDVLAQLILKVAAIDKKAKEKPEMDSLQELQGRLTAEQQVAHLGRICALQAKKLRGAEAKLMTLKKQVVRLKNVADETSKELEQERAWRFDAASKSNDVMSLKQQLIRLRKHARERDQVASKHEQDHAAYADSDSLAQIKILEIQLLEYKRQVEEKAKDVKHERSLRFDLESRSAMEMQQLKQQVVELSNCQQRQDSVRTGEKAELEHSPNREGSQVDAGTQTIEDGFEATVQALEMQVFVLELLVSEKSEALAQEENGRIEAEGRIKDLTLLLGFAQAEIVSANERAEEISQISACQGHKVLELTSLLEFFVTRLDEYQKDQVELEAKVYAEQDQKSRVTAELEQERDEKLKLETQLATLDGMIEYGVSDAPSELQEWPLVLENAGRLKNCQDFIGNLKKQVKDLELSEEVLRYRDKVWRRGLLAFDQVLLLCFGVLFAFNRMTILLRDIVPT